MILIIGGAGYIGSHTNKLLHLKGYDTVVYDSLINGYREFVKWGYFIQGDLSNQDQIRYCFKTYPIQAVMHFGGFIEVKESVADPTKYYQNNLVNTLKLLNVMREFGARYFIFSSSCATYGAPQKIPLTEDHQQLPINPYGWSKFMVEQILKDYDHAYGIKHVILRYFNAAGADPEAEIGEKHNPETHLIPLILDVAMGKRENVKIFGTDYDTPDGTCIRDYIHINDLADAHILSLEYLEKNNKSNFFNLGNGNGFSVREVIQTSEKVSNKKIRIIETNRRSGDPPILIGSSQKAMDVLGWTPKFKELPTIIETAWRWHQQH